MPAARPFTVLLLASLASVVVAPVPAGAAAATASSPAPVVSYEPPVDAPVIDPFRPPTGPYGPGNRGLDYGTSPGDAVHASADGVVIFAGQVGGTLHLTLRHADGLRTSYSFLASIHIRENDRVRQGDVLGTAGGPFHFGVRDVDDHYLDPALLFTGSLRPEVHLVPGPDDGGPPNDGRTREIAAFGAAVRERLAEAGAFGQRVAADVVAGWRVRARAAADVASPSHLASLARVLEGWYLQRDRCTPPSSAPALPAARHIAVLVGGIGSSSGNAAVDRVDTAALGYAPDDVVHFSYRADGSAYGPADTEQDLHESAGRLAAVLARVAAAHPGVPIDVIAHSQGGVVARLAIETTPPPGEVHTVVTLATPHHGANLATAMAAVRLDPRLGALLRAAHASGRLELDPDAPSIAQLAETSGTIVGLDRTPWPPAVRLVSIGASGDLTVPAPRTVVGDGSTSTVVTLGGLHAHDDLPGSAAAQREIALAVSGAPPTCRTLPHVLADALGSESIDALEDDLTAIAAWAPVVAGPALPH